MQRSFVKIHRWLLPVSLIYGWAVRLRNYLFDIGVKKSRQFDVPVIAVGNISVGGSGKTPVVEYLISLLKGEVEIAVLSRGYKRKSKGYVLANKDTTVAELGDEAYWFRKKHPDIHIAVDADRCNGIDRLLGDWETCGTGLVLLDDAYQHRYVKPGVNMLLVDCHRLISDDCLLPAGRLREPQEGKRRADIVVVTKCPQTMTASEFDDVERSLALEPHQKLFFATLTYCDLQPIYYGQPRTIDSIAPNENILLITGIASPKQILFDMQPYWQNIVHVSFPDHHQFTRGDIDHINAVFRSMPYPKIVVTTEKDSIRFFGLQGVADEIRHNIYTLPVKVKLMRGQEEEFNNQIIDYVRKNSRDRRMD